MRGLFLALPSLHSLALIVNHRHKFSFLRFVKTDYSHICGTYSIDVGETSVHQPKLTIMLSPGWLGESRDIVFIYGLCEQYKRQEKAFFSWYGPCKIFYLGNFYLFKLYFFNYLGVYLDSVKKCPERSCVVCSWCDFKSCSTICSHACTHRWLWSAVWWQWVSHEMLLEVGVWRSLPDHYGATTIKATPS